jgi:hypothetical protein
MTCVTVFHPQQRIVCCAEETYNYRYNIKNHFKQLILDCAKKNQRSKAKVFMAALFINLPCYVELNGTLYVLASYQNNNKMQGVQRLRYQYNGLNNLCS